jgi:hypothetical protein
MKVLEIIVIFLLILISILFFLYPDLVNQILFGQLWIVYASGITFIFRERIRINRKDENK